MQKTDIETDRPPLGVRMLYGTGQAPIRLSRKTLSTIKTNLFWAFAYNVAAIPLPHSACSTRC